MGIEDFEDRFDELWNIERVQDMHSWLSSFLAEAEEELTSGDFEELKSSLKDQVTDWATDHAL